MFLTIALFPIYYNVLAQFVSRRDELVLKRLRTGQTRDAELLASVALPGAAAALLYTALAVLSAVMFTAFAYWTAAWTRDAEAAQLTSMPIILLASVGPLAGSLPNMPDRLGDLLSLTPGAAMSDLIRIGWFGLDGHDATDSTLTFAQTWGQAAGPLLVIAAWTCLAVLLARSSMRWEPRA